ncbi:Lrp/AsnC family transcriptional regulator [Spirillospora sp. NPDC048911]|uniref:Lrp/AsnC family transcriptional regulator n=1 Tax=Spirillospora sp. NPDC048911 TaxID=3364527 RepID=UPI00371C3DF1
MLDSVDVSLLAVLQEDGRASYQTLADRVGLSRTAVRSRVHRLLESGIVTIVGAVHPAVCGLDADAWLLVRAQGDPVLAARALSARTAVYASQVTTGNHDVVARIRARDDAALVAEVDEIRDEERVQAVSVFRTVTTVRDTQAIAALYEPCPLDPVDWELLALLQRDVRGSFVRLSQAVGLSRAATRTRVSALLQSGIIRVVAVADPRTMGQAVSAGFGLTITAGARQTTARVAMVPGVRALARGWGPYDVLGEITASSPPVLATSLSEIGAIAGVAACTSWSVLEVVATPAPVDVSAERQVITTVPDPRAQTVC